MTGGEGAVGWRHSERRDFITFNALKVQCGRLRSKRRQKELKKAIQFFVWLSEWKGLIKQSQSIKM